MATKDSAGTKLKTFRRSDGSTAKISVPSETGGSKVAVTKTTGAPLPHGPKPSPTDY